MTSLAKSILQSHQNELESISKRTRLWLGVSIIGVCLFPLMALIEVPYLASFTTLVVIGILGFLYLFKYHHEKSIGFIDTTIVSTQVDQFIRDKISDLKIELPQEEAKSIVLGSNLSYYYLKHPHRLSIKGALTHTTKDSSINFIFANQEIPQSRQESASELPSSLFIEIKHPQKNVRAFESVFPSPVTRSKFKYYLSAFFVVLLIFAISIRFIDIEGDFNFIKMTLSKTLIVGSIIGGLFPWVLEAMQFNRNRVAAKYSSVFDTTDPLAKKIHDKIEEHLLNFDLIYLQRNQNKMQIILTPKAHFYESRHLKYYLKLPKITNAQSSKVFDSWSEYLVGLSKTARFLAHELDK